MAAGTKLSITFTTSDGTTTMNFAQADPDAEATDLYAAANAIITNGAIYQKIPTGIKTVKLVTTTENVVNPPA